MAKTTKEITIQQFIDNLPKLSSNDLMKLMLEANLERDKRLQDAEKETNTLKTGGK